MNILERLVGAVAMIASLLGGGITKALAQDVRVETLSERHALVRVDGGGRYLLLPVQESAPEATVNVLADTRKERDFTVRLAMDKVDYLVPLDLGGLAGRKVILDINLRPREGRGTAAQIDWKALKLSDVFEPEGHETYRPLYHFAPDYGWMNDPNGMVYKDGEWHLFFQYNPFGSQWGNMTWGHAVTRDLVSWKQIDNAIEPDPLGAIFSGSAVEDKENVSGFGAGAIVAMFTSAGQSQTQSIAYSVDGGRTFTKYAGNPVIVYDAPDFRDPKMFLDKGTGQWKVVIAAGQEVQFWTSKNLREWSYESSFGRTYGSHAGVWECPDLVRIGDKDVLIVNINPGGPAGGSATQYFVGKFDGHAFRPDEAPEVTRWMDHGKDHYATVTWSGAPDGRVVALAWMSNWEYAGAVPTKVFRSANSIPRDLSLVKSGNETILKSSPSPEMEALRGTPVRKKVSKSPMALFAEPHQAYELVIRFNIPKGKEASFTLRNDEGEKVEMTFDGAAGEFSMDRRASGETGFSKTFPTVTKAPTNAEGKTELRLFVDAASVEAFGEDFVMTNLVFPSTPYNRIYSNGVKADITIYPLAK